MCDRDGYDRDVLIPSSTGLGIRIVLDIFGEYLCPQLVLFTSVVFLTFSATPIEFLLNSLAFTYVAKLDEIEGVPFTPPTRMGI